MIKFKEVKGVMAGDVSPVAKFISDTQVTGMRPDPGTARNSHNAL